jgi:hypothetical protein
MTKQETTAAPAINAKALMTLTMMMLAQKLLTKQEASAMIQRNEKVDKIRFLKS